MCICVTLRADGQLWIPPSIPCVPLSRHLTPTNLAITIRHQATSAADDAFNQSCRAVLATQARAFVIVLVFVRVGVWRSTHSARRRRTSSHAPTTHNSHSALAVPPSRS